MNYYDAIAEGYSELHEEEQRAKYELIRSLANVEANHAVLDVGCGPGWGSEYFDAKFVGIDPSKELINQGLKKGLDLHHTGAESLPFEENSFDTVISVTAIQNFQDLDKGIQEISRVAKRDIIISCLKASPKLHDVEMKLRDKFIVMDVLENSHDLFFLCQKREKLK